MSKIKLFESKQIRSVWNDADQKWYFAVVDVVQVLTDSSNPTDYLKKLRKRDPELAKGWGQIVTPLLIDTAGEAAVMGGTIAGNARKALERESGEKVVTSENYLPEKKKKQLKSKNEK